MRGKKRWLWRAVDQDGFVLDVLVQSRRNTKVTKRLMRKLPKRQGSAPRVMNILSRNTAMQCMLAGNGKLGSYGTAKRRAMPGVGVRNLSTIADSARSINEATLAAAF